MSIHLRESVAHLSAIKPLLPQVEASPLTQLGRSESPSSTRQPRSTCTSSSLKKAYRLGRTRFCFATISSSRSFGSQSSGVYRSWHPDNEILGVMMMMLVLATPLFQLNLTSDMITTLILSDDSIYLIPC